MYQSVLAAIALVLAIVHVVAGPLVRLVHIVSAYQRSCRDASVESPRRKTRSPSLRFASTPRQCLGLTCPQLVVVAVIVAVAFACHAVFVFALALSNPGTAASLE